MKIYKNNGFTLSETLITLSIVGVLALIVVPGLIKDTMNRATISMVKSAVTNISDAINNELVKTRAISILETDIYLDPVKFLKTLDVKNTESSNSLFPSKYKSINGTIADTPEMDASASLKNGVTFGIIKNETGNSQMYIDTNGKKGPNIYGVDCFIVTIINKNNDATGDHIGDVGCSAADETDLATCKEDGSTCFCALERSGYDHRYLELTDIY